MTDPRQDITPSSCPSCGYHLDAASHTTDADTRPTPGDYSVCINCGELLRFTEAMTVERLSGRELDDLETQEPEVYAELWKASRTIIAMRPDRE